MRMMDDYAERCRREIADLTKDLTEWEKGYMKIIRTIPGEKPQDVTAEHIAIFKRAIRTYEAIVASIEAKNA